MKLIIAAAVLILTTGQLTFAQSQNNPFPTPTPTPKPWTNSIEYYTNDTCGGSLIGISDATHSCDLLVNPPADAWSLRVNGVCLNTVDMPAAQACEKFSKRDFSKAIYFFTNDTCTSTITAVVDADTDCETLSSSQSVWSIFKNNRCLNIVDSNEVVACQRFR